MPATSKRFTFTPTAETLAAVERIAGVSRQPVSAIVSQAMELVTPHLEALAGFLEQADTLQDQARAIMAVAAEKASGDLRPHALKAEAVMADLMRTIEEATAPEPPSSNTGVTFPPAQPESKG